MGAAIEIPGFRASFTAGADLTSSQFTVVALSDDLTVVACDDSAVPYGILQNNPDEGEEATVVRNGISKIIIGSGGDLAAGAIVASDSSGEAIEATTGAYAIGQIVVGAATGAVGSIDLSIMLVPIPA